MVESVMVELLCGAGGGSDGVGDGGGPSKNVRPPFGGLTVCHELFDALIPRRPANGQTPAPEAKVPIEGSKVLYSTQLFEGQQKE